MTKMSMNTRWLEDFSFPINPLILKLFGNTLNLFLVNVPILYPLKARKNIVSAGVFRGYKNGNIGQKWVILVELVVELLKKRFVLYKKHGWMYKAFWAKRSKVAYTLNEPYGPLGYKRDWSWWILVSSLVAMQIFS